MGVAWVYDDGGRKAAGYKGKTGDCTWRAVAIATGIPYREAYDLLCKFSAINAEPPNEAGRTGPASLAMKHLGWTWVPTMKIGSGCQVHLHPDELPSGRIIAVLSGHWCAVIDGVIHDTYDPSRGGMRCVYGYWSETGE